MTLIENMALPNTLGLTSYAEFGCVLNDLEDVFAAREFAKKQGISFRVIGVGSNMVMSTTCTGTNPNPPPPEP